MGGIDFLRGDQKFSLEIHGQKSRFRAERFGPVLGPENFKTPGLDRTRTNTILKISDQFGPIGPVVTIGFGFNILE